VTTPTPTPEDEVRALLRHEVDSIHASADLDARVRRGARRRRRLSAGVAGTTALLAVGGALLAGLPRTSSGEEEATVQPAGALTCPATAPAIPLKPSGRAGADRVLVPGSPTAAVACTYETAAGTATLVGGQGPIALTGAVLSRLVAALDQPIHPYAFRCLPNARYPVLMLRFAYPSGPPLVVAVPRICPTLTNGALSGAFNPHGYLPTTITALFAKD
jgi:hypothetical protein